MTSVIVVVPVLNRPERVEPLVDSFLSTLHDVPCDLLFVASPNDDAEIDAINVVTGGRIGITGHVGLVAVTWEPGPADWARKINVAYKGKGHRYEWIFTGADDLCFCPGWADRALECAAATGARVIGTNDLGNPRVMNGSHATHNLVSREYADTRGTIDGPGAVVSEAYDHNFVDDELVHTARARRAWTFCADSEVPHLHPHWGEAEWDDTYEKGQRRFDADRRLFHRRRRGIRVAR